MTFTLNELMISILIIVLLCMMWPNKEGFSDYRFGYYSKNRDELNKELLYN